MSSIDRFAVAAYESYLADDVSFGVFVRDDGAEFQCSSAGLVKLPEFAASAAFTAGSAGKVVDLSAGAAAASLLVAQAGGLPLTLASEFSLASLYLSRGLEFVFTGSLEDSVLEMIEGRFGFSLADAAVACDSGLGDGNGVASLRSGPNARLWFSLVRQLVRPGGFLFLTGISSSWVNAEYADHSLKRNRLPGHVVGEFEFAGLSSPAEFLFSDPEELSSLASPYWSLLDVERFGSSFRVIFE